MADIFEKIRSTITDRNLRDTRYIPSKEKYSPIELPIEIIPFNLTVYKRNYQKYLKDLIDGSVMQARTRINARSATIDCHGLGAKFEPIISLYLLSCMLFYIF